MRQKLVAALAACAFMAAAFGATVTPANAHYPATIWYKAQKWWLSDSYDPDYCFRHHGYYYCKRSSGY